MRTLLETIAFQRSVIVALIALAFLLVTLLAGVILAGRERLRQMAGGWFG